MLQYLDPIPFGNLSILQLCQTERNNLRKMKYWKSDGVKINLVCVKQIH